MTLKKKYKKTWTPDLSKSKHAVHPLSMRPGGAAVHVEYESGEVRTYRNVKNPNSYIKAIWNTHNAKIDNDDYPEYTKKIINIWTKCF